MLNVEASKAAHNLISKWVIGCPIAAKLILQLPGPYYFLQDGWEPGRNTFSSSTGGSVIEPTHIRYCVRNLDNEVTCNRRCMQMR